MTIEQRKELLENLINCKKAFTEYRNAFSKINGGSSIWESDILGEIEVGINCHIYEMGKSIKKYDGCNDYYVDYKGGDKNEELK